MEDELGKASAGQEGLLYNMLAYQLGWVDEQGVPMNGPSCARMHPFLCLMACESLIGDYTPALAAAAAVELVHNFCLIHEDVQAGSPNRNERPTIWWIWGPGQAINAGDGLHAMARLALMRLQDREISVTRVLKAMRLLDQTCLTMCEGQYLDLDFQEKLDVGVDSYLKMAAGRTGALMACAMGLGAIAATEEDTPLEAFKECGKNLGIAYQIREDIRDLGENARAAPSDRVLNKKKLLPIVYALAKGELPAKRELGTLYFKRVLEPQDVKQLVKVLNETSALEYAQERAEEYSRIALESLEGVALSSWGREELAKLCQRIAAPEA